MGSKLGNFLKQGVFKKLEDYLQPFENVEQLGEPK